MCCQPEVIPNRVEIQWVAGNSRVFPFTSSLPSTITGYVLNHQSSSGPVTVNFLRGGSVGSPLGFHLNVNIGAYQSFTVLDIDTIQITSDTDFASGELNITINVSPL